VNTQPLRSIHDLAGHVLLHADDGREWHTWLATADALDLARGPHHFMGDARLAIEGAICGNGVALGDSMTASGLLAKGQLVAPFDLAVSAVDSFHVACRSEAKAAPIVRVFIDWLFAALDEESSRGQLPGTKRQKRSVS
jgi:LysR family glycine cleavage system transcriptional activator